MLLYDDQLMRNNIKPLAVNEGINEKLNERHYIVRSFDPEWTTDFLRTLLKFFNFCKNSLQSFSKYGSCRVEWPNKESRHARISTRRAKITGYVYMIFENDLAVKKLLQDCSQEFGTAGEWYFKLTARRANGLEIRQVFWSF